MRVLIDIQHPANLLLFKEFARIFHSRDNQVLFTTRDKDVTIQLFDSLKFDYISFGKNYKSLPGKMIGLLRFDHDIIRAARQFKPDLFLSHGSIYAAHASFVLRKPNISFNAVDSDVLLKLNKPFTSVYLTSRSFKKKLGKKHLMYSGFHELAYLHPNYFKPDVAVLEKYGIKKNEKFVIVRFVSWKAYDDIGKNGFSNKEKILVTEKLCELGRVFISSECDLPPELTQYKLNIYPSDLQSLEYYSSLLLGESGSMAAECAMLGTPALYVSNKNHGFISDLSQKYDLIHQFTDVKSALVKAIELLQDSETREIYKKRRDCMLVEMIDVTAFMVWFIENFPQSQSIIQNNPDYQFQFK